MKTCKEASTAGMERARRRLEETKLEEKQKATGVAAVENSMEVS